MHSLALNQSRTARNLQLKLGRDITVNAASDGLKPLV
jgi:hypothetical protein